MGCKARRELDEMKCAKCGLAWGITDPHPPECGLTAPQKPVRFTDVKSANFTLPSDDATMAGSKLTIEKISEAARLILDRHEKLTHCYPLSWQHKRGGVYDIARENVQSGKAIYEDLIKPGDI